MPLRRLRLLLIRPLLRVLVAGTLPGPFRCRPDLHHRGSARGGLPAVDDEIARLGRAAAQPDRLSPVRTTAAYGHHTGRLPDGRQALVTCGYPKRVCVYLFTPEGDYIGVERHTPSLEAD